VGREGETGAGERKGEENTEGKGQTEFHSITLTLQDSHLKLGLFVHLHVHQGIVLTPAFNPQVPEHLLMSTSEATDRLDVAVEVLPILVGANVALLPQKTQAEHRRQHTNDAI